MDSYNMGYETETIYKSLRGTLDELGYQQALSFDSLYLVKALVADLIKTTQSLKHYKELAQKTLDTCSELEVGIHPYKEDNARLQKECNQLHKKLIAQKDRHEDVQKDLKAKLRRCELDKDELEFRNGELSAKLCDVEKECLKKNERILELQNVILKRHPHRNNSATKLNIGKGDQGSFETKLKSSTSLDSTVSLLKEADAKTKVLRNEVKDLRQKLEERRYVIESLEAKINSRDLEIHRLSSLLEGGRPVSAVIQDHGVAKTSQIQMFCTCKKDCHFAGLERANLKLERKLKECLRRQHDAMLHALRLSEKNKLLESRLQNKEDKKESEKNHKDMIELQEKINSLTKLIEGLKKENQTNMKTIKSKTTSFSSKETISYSELKEKLEDYKIMEKDFMKELDRLERENSLQKSYIADLEKKLLACMSSKEEVERKSKLLQSHINENKDASKTSETQAAQVSSSTPHSDQRFESLLKERDYYQKEYAFIVDRLNSIPLRVYNNSRESPLNNLTNLILERDDYYRQTGSLQQQLLSENKSDAMQSELKRRLSDQGRQISDLKHKYRLLEDDYSKAAFTVHSASGQGPFATHASRDKADETSRKRASPNGTGVDLDTYLTLQNERDELFVVNCKLQEEKAELLSRIKKVKFDTSLIHEDRLRSLESERNDLMSKQAEMNSKLGESEEENRMLRQKLYSCEHDLCEEKNSRNSARRMQEQQDHALLSFRRTQESLESQISELKHTNSRLDSMRQELECKVHSLQDDNIRLKTCLHNLDSKNDSILRSLDSKTDLLDRMERDVTGKDTKIEQLEDRIAKLKSTLESMKDKLSHQNKITILHQDKIIGEIETNKFHQYKIIEPIKTNIFHQDKIIGQIESNIFYQNKIIDQIETNIFYMFHHDIIARVKNNVFDKKKVLEQMENNKLQLDTIIGQIKANIFYEDRVISQVKSSKYHQYKIIDRIETNVFHHDQIIEEIESNIDQIQSINFLEDDVTDPIEVPLLQEGHSQTYRTEDFNYASAIFCKSPPSDCIPKPPPTWVQLKCKSIYSN